MRTPFTRTKEIGGETVTVEFHYIEEGFRYFLRVQCRLPGETEPRPARIVPRQKGLDPEYVYISWDVPVYFPGVQKEIQGVKLPLPDKPLEEWLDVMDDNIGFRNLTDERSRAYILKVVDSIGLQEFRTGECGDEDDPYDEPGWERVTGRYAPDGFSYTAARFSGKARMDDVLALRDLAREVGDHGPVRTCWECGRKFHWLDTGAGVRVSIMKRLSALQDRYCGC